jgi:RNA polymerase primary sigma factor
MKVTIVIDQESVSIPEMDPAKIVEKAMLPHDLGLALAKIGKREAEIIRMRYGLNGKSPMTLNDIGKKMKLSGCRVQQLEERALLRLRRHAARLCLIDVVVRLPHPDLQPGWVVKK